MSYAVRAWRDAKGESGITIGTVTPGGYDNYVAEITLGSGEIAAFMSQCAVAARRGAAAAGILSEPMPGPYDSWEDDTAELQRLLDEGHPIPPGQFRTTSTLTLQDPGPEEPMSTTTQTLAERITSVLVAAGFRAVGDTPARGGGFLVTPGVGVTVSVAWLNARTSERAALLTKYENRLRDDGLTVENREGYLYVAALTEGKP